MPRLRTLTVVVVLAALVACSGEPLRVTSIQLGRSLNTDNTVARPTTTFGPGDTVYLSILTAGSGTGTLSVRWSFAGRVVGEPKKPVEYRGEAATEFHLQNGAGFPPGEYSVEAFLDDKPVGSRTFRVTTDR
jgi:hypothetical protein